MATALELALNAAIAIAAVMFGLRVWTVHARSGGAGGLAVAAEPGLNPVTSRSVAAAQPTQFAGPQEMRPIVGRCDYFQDKKSATTYELCGFKSVRQILGGESHYMGFFKRWETASDADSAADPKRHFVAQVYDNGDNCPGFGDRQARVVFTCKADVPKLELLEVTEAVPCHYQLTFGTVWWCPAKGKAA